MTWLSGFLSQFLNGLVSNLFNWYQTEKLRADARAKEALEQSLKSVKEQAEKSRQLHDAMKKRLSEDAPTTDDWNAGL